MIKSMTGFASLTHEDERATIGVTVRAVNPNWRMWSPIRHLLDEIGQARIEAHVRRMSGKPTVH